MKRIRVWVGACAMLIVLCSAMTALAGNVPVGTDLLANLVGGSPIAVTDLLVSDMSMSNMKSDVYSRAYTGDNGLFAYLYQVDNKGVAGNSSLELFTLWPFTGADDTTTLGYLTDLTDLESSGFLNSTGYTPESFSYVDGTTDGGPEMTFYFTKQNQRQIPPTQHSKVLYVLSPYGPTEIVGNVIDGAVGSGPVVGPVPEPAALVHLLAGGLATLGFISYRRRVQAVGRSRR